jgi:predicted Fe-Mo cluster-binding NifX family protein
LCKTTKFTVDKINKEIINMKIALPVSNGVLCMHFGHCDEFAIIEVESDKKTIIGNKSVTPPPHEPGLLPRWLQEMEINLVIAGGMGMRAQQLFSQAGVEVIVGAQAKRVEELVKDYLEGNLKTGVNACDH